MTNDFQLPQVKFRYDIVAFGETRARLLDLYQDKFAGLMRCVLATKLNAIDYEDLPRMREALRTRPKLQDVSAAACGRISQDNLKKLLDSAPIYNVCPLDLKGYILLALGLRSSHLTELV